MNDIEVTQKAVRRDKPYSFPVFFIRTGMWWAQTNDRLGLVSGSGVTQEEAREAWQHEYEEVKNRREE